jgi:hypothetical protein
MDPTEFAESWERIFTMTRMGLIATTGLSVLAVVATFAWCVRHRPLSKEIRYSLILSICAALPGLVFASDVILRWLLLDQPRFGYLYEDPTTLIACFWLFFGPLLLVASWGVRRRVESPRSLWLLQGSHALVLASSVFTSFLCTLYV